MFSNGLGLVCPSAANSQTLADMPMASQYAISAAIGNDQAAYHAATCPGGFALANPANGFTAQLQSGVLHLSAGADTWAMSLESVNLDGAMQPVKAARVSAAGNRVDCNYGSIKAWYVNGPDGLQQGFTIAQPPQSMATRSRHDTDGRVGLGRRPERDGQFGRRRIDVRAPR